MPLHGDNSKQNDLSCCAIRNGQIFVLECALRPEGMNSNVFVGRMQAFLTQATVNKFSKNRLRHGELGKTMSPQIDAS